MEDKTFEYKFSFTQEDVQKFAEVTGDFNPIHLDAEYAKCSFFKKPIVHGFLAGSVFSKIFGTLFPGEGTIYLKQEMKFMAPMFVDIVYLAKVRVKAQMKEKSRALIETNIEDGKGNSIILGEATIQHEIFK